MSNTVDSTTANIIHDFSYILGNVVVGVAIKAIVAPRSLYSDGVASAHSSFEAANGKIRKFRRNGKHATSATSLPGMHRRKAGNRLTKHA
jgi:hypothetical protein